MIRSGLFATITSAIVCISGTSTALAQPADRPAAFTQAINTASALAPGWNFYEAKLENDDGVWLFDIEFFNSNGSQKLEYELNASTFAVISSESEPTTSAQQSEFAAIIAVLNTSPTTPAQAIIAAAPRTPAGALMDRIEREFENTTLVYKFEFSNSSRVLINAATGQPTSGGTGGGMPQPGDPTVDGIIQVALNAYPGARIIEVEFESDDNRWEVKLITSTSVVRKLRISTAGAILSDEIKNSSKEEKAEDRLKLAGNTGATITFSQAAQIALNSAPGATVIKNELEFERGIAVYEVTVVDSAGTRTIYVNATSGAIVTPTAPPAPTPEPTPVLSPANAITAALNANPGTIAVGVEMEPEGGRQFFKVRTLTITQPLRLRENVVDGKTGVVWSSTLMPMSTSFLSTARTILNRMSGATTTFAQAQQAALSTLGDGLIKSIELEPEGSGLVYKVEVLVGTKTFKLVVNASTGALKPQ